MYLARRFYIVLVGIILLLGSGYVYAPLFVGGQVLLCLFLWAVFLDGFFLFRTQGIRAFRSCADRFSNGDENEVRIQVENGYRHWVKVELVDEIPFLFQRRDVSFSMCLASEEGKTMVYTLRPTCRGVYAFGYIRVFVTGRLGLIIRRYTCGNPVEVKVYPSFLRFHQYELAAVSRHLSEWGMKRIRKVGHHTEFEQIKEYVKGDDFRTINWKASARRDALMVNVYQDERSQPVYCVIDKGREMQQAFRGMTLLDYAINASLVLSYVALRKEDKVGLITFDTHCDTFVPASRQSGTLQTLLENLYQQQTTFGESDLSALCVQLERCMSKRSLLVLYTNFSGMTSLNRQLTFLEQLNRRHRLLVVFFEDAEVRTYASTPAMDTEGYYQRVIAEKFVQEKRLLVATLRQQGIYALLTTPEQLSVDVMNQYLEMKSRQGL